LSGDWDWLWLQGEDGGGERGFGWSVQSQNRWRVGGT